MAIRVWEYLKIAKMEWIVLICVFAFDLITKSIVENTVPVNGVVEVIPKFFNVHRLHNYAAAFGADFLKSWFGDLGARIFYSVFAVAASVAFVLVLIRQKGKSRWFRVAIALFVAGAMGNCIDRMFLGYVRDFIEFVYFGLTIWGRQTWYVFNIADAALVAGVIMIVIYFLFMYKDNDKSKLAPPVSSDARSENDGSESDAPSDSENENTESNGTSEETDTEIANSDNEVNENVASCDADGNTENISKDESGGEPAA